MMQWERKQVNGEMAKLLGEIQSLEDSIDARDKTIANLLKIASKAEHDRDRYMRRVEKLQKHQPKYILTPKIPKNITLDDLLKNTYIVENWDNSVEIIPPREEIEKAIAEKFYELAKVWFGDDEQNYYFEEVKILAKSLGVEIKEN